MTTQTARQASNLATFDQFILSLEQDFGEQGKGKPFEVFCKWFLENDPEWSKTVDKVWLWDDYPYKWQRQDLGTDLVFRDNKGLTWAVQAKCYGEHITTTKGDMDSFLTDMGRTGVDRGLWMQLKYLAILIMLLTGHAFAGTTESTLQYILDDYQAQCEASQEESMVAVPEGEDLSAVRITVHDDSIYEIAITADGKKATVFYANPWCPQIGSAWCGSGGCKSYVIVDGVSFEAFGGMPTSASASENNVVVLVGRSGGACVNTNGRKPSNNVSCYSVAVWDDQSKTFNSIGSDHPVFKLSDFMP